MTAAKGPLGVFDSGVGGLTVVGALLRRFPNERVLYVADQAHVPYGGRPLEQVCGYASAISAFLADQGCRAVVMACNISSATALAGVREALAPRPVLGVIAPAARRAAQLMAGASGPIGVLATEGTVRSGAYDAAIRACNPTARVMQVPCPAFVPLVESGQTEGDEALAAALECVGPLAEAGCPAVVLGCTHYPFLLPVLRRAAAELYAMPPLFVDPADEMAAALLEALPDAGSAPPAGGSLLLSTGEPAVLAAQAGRFLPGIEVRVGHALWDATDTRLQRCGDLPSDQRSAAG